MKMVSHIVNVTVHNKTRFMYKSMCGRQSQKKVDLDEKEKINFIKDYNTMIVTILDKTYINKLLML